MEDRIPQSAIDAIAKHINGRSNKQYNIPVVGTVTNHETPQIFEIIPFDLIDKTDSKFYAIDGSSNSHSFYNGVSIGLYQGGYVCFQSGKQVRMNAGTDPIMLGQAYTPQNILITCEDHLFSIYDELLTLQPVKRFLEFTESTPEDVFPYSREAVCLTTSSLLGFCQEVLEWSLIYEISCRNETRPGDFILRDGTLRSPNIKQEYLVRLGDFLANEKHIILVGITKSTPIKVELAYTFKQIDSYLQDKLKPRYPFSQSDPKQQKLCCWFEVPDAVLLNAYGSSTGNMFIKKGIKGGRGIGVFFAARLDYVEKLQNYDWVIADLNIFDVVPDIRESDLTRSMETLNGAFHNLTRLTQEHYILGYPYPLVEAHNFITLDADFKQEVINRVKHSMYSEQQMDNVDIENMFLDIHARF